MVLNRAELLLQARNYAGSGDWLDESGNGHDAQLGSTSGADTNDPLFKAYDGTQYLYSPGTSGNHVTSLDINLLSANSAHGEQGAGDWATGGTNTIVTALASAESIPHPMTALLPNAGFMKVWKVTYQDDAALASLALTLTAAAYTFSVYCYLPAGWDGGDITIDDGGTFASESSVTSQAADDGTLGSWQQIWRKFTPDAGDLTGTLTLSAAGTPTAGKVIYLASACLRSGSIVTFRPSIRIQTDLDLRCKVTADDYTPAGSKAVLSTGPSGGGSIAGINLLLLADGRFQLQWQTSTTLGIGRIAASHMPADGQPVDLRFTYTDATDTFTPYVNGVSVAVESNQNLSAWPPTLLFGQATYVGAETRNAFWWSGDIDYVELRDGIDGPVALRYDAADAAEPFATQVSTTDGRTWTYNRSASGLVSTVVDRDMFLLTTDDYMEIPDDAALDFTETEPFTLMALVRTNTVAAGQDVAVAKKDDLTTAAGYALGRTTAASQVILADGTADDDDTTGTMVTHTLYALAGVRNITDDDVEAFLSGTGSGTPTTDSTTATLSNALPLRIGATSGTAANFWEGQIIAVVLWREALSDADIITAGNELLGIFESPSTGRLLVLGLL